MRFSDFFQDPVCNADDLIAYEEQINGRIVKETYHMQDFDTTLVSTSVHISTYQNITLYYYTVMPMVYMQLSGNVRRSQYFIAQELYLVIYDSQLMIINMYVNRYINFVQYSQYIRPIKLFDINVLVNPNSQSFRINYIYIL